VEKLKANINRLFNIDPSLLKWVYLLFGIGGISDFIDLSVRYVSYQKVKTIYNLPLSVLQTLDLILGVMLLVSFYLIWKRNFFRKEYYLFTNLLMVLWSFASAYNGLFLQKDHSTGFFSLIIGLLFVYLSTVIFKLNLGKIQRT
jgi:tryptophan-rich sensory protein